MAKTTPQPKDWKALERHPLSAEYVDLCGPDWVAFVAGMRERRFDPAHPIVLYEGKVLDGWQRQRACAMTFVTPTYIEYAGDDPEGYVKQENDFRRHETPLQKDQRIEAREKKVAQLRVKGKSFRAIAEEVGVSKSQIENDLSNCPPVDSSPKGGKIKGKDGKTRTAKPKKKKPKALLKCDRCTRLNLDRDDCEQCISLNEESVRKVSSRSAASGNDYNAKFEKLYDSMVLLIDQRAQVMGKDKYHKESIHALFRCREQYKFWSCQKTER